MSADLDDERNGPEAEYSRLCNEIICSVPNRIVNDLNDDIDSMDEDILDTIGSREDAYAWAVNFQDRWVSLPFPFLSFPFISLIPPPSPSDFVVEGCRSRRRRSVGGPAHSARLGLRLLSTPRLYNCRLG